MKTAAVIGCGRSVEGKVGWAIGHEHGRGYREADPGLRLCAVDRDPANLAAFRARFSVATGDCFSSTEELYTKLVPDVVSICTWPGLHAPMVIEAAERGVRGIICEKPMALNPLEMGKMLAACKKSGARLSVAHQRRHEPIFLRAKALLQQGAIGTDFVIEARVGDNWDILSWTTHWFDMANFLLDAKPLWVLAGLDHTGQRRYQHAVEDNSVVLAQYPGENQALFVTGPGVPSGSWFHIRGNAGLMVLHGTERIELFNKSGFLEEKIARGASPFTAMVKEMLEGAGSDAAMLCDASGTSCATEMAYAVQESARTLRKVELPLAVGYAALELVQARPKTVLPAGEIVLFADAHFSSGGREGIADAIREESGRECRLVAAEQGLKPGDLEGAGLILVYHTQPEADETTKRLLSAWVDGKRPLMIVHAGLGAYPQWPEYMEWCGRVWAWGKSSHPHQPSMLAVLAPDLKIPWKEAWLPEDEVFIDLEQKAPCHDLVSVTLPGRTFPAAWVHGVRPNIGVWVPGHRRDFWNVPAIRQGFLAVLDKLSAGSVHET